MKKFLKSLLRSFKEAFIANEEVQKLKNKHPGIVLFFRQRFDTAKFTGLPVTILGAAFLYVLTIFFGAIEDFVTSDLIVSADVRINTLLYVFRNISAVKVFLWITLLGESPVIIVFGLVVSSVLWLSRKKWQVAALWLTIVGSEGFTFVAKIIFHRPRPVTAVFLEDSASFPSGHATIAVAFYGFIIYLLLRHLKKKKYRALAILAGIIIMLAVGFSRLYLGVHYLSDIWTGYLVGLLWLIIGIGVTEWKIFSKQPVSHVKEIQRRHKNLITAGLIGVALIFYVIYGLFYHPELIPKNPVTVQATAAKIDNIFKDYSLPRFTETIIGETQEPVSFVITAKDDAALITDFEKAGWNLADTVNFSSTAELVKFVILNKDYPTAPMTPSFWNKQVHDFGFEKATEVKTVRQRHHARFWKTNLKTSQGENIYVGAASLDTGIKWFITHKISPDIDTERELLFTDLQKTGAVENFKEIKLVSPVLGKNFSGDQFFTDGQAYFVVFKRKL